MRHYTKRVPFELAVKLKDAGFPQEIYPKYIIENGGAKGHAYSSGSLSVYLDVIDAVIKRCGGSTASAPTYADVLDFLMDKGIDLSVHKAMYVRFGETGRYYHFHINDLKSKDRYGDWEDAMTAAIEAGLSYR